MPVSQVDGSFKAPRGLSPVARIVSNPLPSTALKVVGTKSPSFAVVLNCSSIGGASTEDAVRLESPYSFADTLTRLQSTLESKDFRIFVAIDHRAAARSVGLRPASNDSARLWKPKRRDSADARSPRFCP